MVILLIACVVGVTAGTLTFLSSHSLAQALLSAGTAAGGTTSLLAELLRPIVISPAPVNRANEEDRASASRRG
ncbi:hypothetical protein ACQPZP_18005 [Spirillospora sp. CA-142024]|uniref:hypothetical protein n=1 Tax=Spirillospora sp. CA-142024 TaxID=3240036 RepID=UPI003D91346E